MKRIGSYGHLILMVKKAITDVVALKKNIPPKYDWTPHIESTVLTHLGKTGIISTFPLSILHIQKRQISSLSYYLGILLDIPPVYEETLKIATEHIPSSNRERIDTLTLALDILDRLLMIKEWEEKAEKSIHDIYRYLLRDFMGEKSTIMGALNILSMLKVADRIDINPYIRQCLIETLKEYGLIDKENVALLTKLIAEKDIPSILCSTP